MKSNLTLPTQPAGASAPVSRRVVFASAGAVGAVAAVAAVLPAVRSQSAPAVAAAAKPAAEADGGYRLTEHIQRYYQTARV